MTNRRHILRGLASLIALPAFDAFGQSSGATAPPRRLAYIYSPNGVNTDLWFPKGVGSDYQLSTSLQPLAPLRDSFQILSNLDLDKAASNGNGAGDHARANAAFLTGCQARKTSGADIRNGISVDQLIANAIGHETRLPSLEISTDEARRSGNCDSGYSCAYQFNLSWRSENTPVPAERDPRLVFEKLFGGGNSLEDQRRIARRKSVLDFVQEDAHRMQKGLGGANRTRLDEYFTSVRELERRIEQAEKFRSEVPEMDRPNGVPESYREHLRTMYDMLELAFVTDTTRVATYMLAHDGSNRTFPEIEVRDSHHRLSHHQKNPRNLESIARIDHFYIEEFARFLGRLKMHKEKDGSSLLDHCMIVHGSGIHDGDRHNHDNLPILLAGGGGGRLHPGQHLQAKEGTPLTNLHLSLLTHMGVKAERVGDSTGKLTGI